MCLQSVDFYGSRLSGKPFELLPNLAQLRASDECRHERQTAFYSGLILQVGLTDRQSLSFPSHAPLAAGPFGVIHAVEWTCHGHISVQGARARKGAHITLRRQVARLTIRLMSSVIQLLEHHVFYIFLGTS